MTRPLAGKRLLLVDDESMFRESLKEELENLGANVSEAFDGQVALEKVGTKGFDAVITDLNMPSMNGLDLLTKLHQAEGKTPYFIMISAHGDELHEKVIQAGGVGAFAKPLDFEAFSESIERVLKTTNQRSSPRVRVEIDVTISEAGKNEMKLRSQNICKGGLFLQGDAGPDAISRIFDFKLTNGVTQPLSGQVIVRWVQPFGDVTGKKGFGVEFVSVQSKEALHSMIAAQLKLILGR